MNGDALLPSDANELARFREYLLLIAKLHLVGVSGVEAQQIACKATYPERDAGDVEAAEVVRGMAANADTKGTT